MASYCFQGQRAENSCCNRQPLGPHSSPQIFASIKLWQISGPGTASFWLLQGVWEKDEIRHDDSFVTFEEVFEIAKEQDADLVLLGGDLFHDNKPSRKTLVKAMDVLGRHCMSDRDISFQIISDQTENFVNG